MFLAGDFVGGQVTGYHAYISPDSFGLPLRMYGMNRTQSDLERLDPAFITHNVITRDLTFYHVKLSHCTTLVEQKRFFFRVILIASY